MKDLKLICPMVTDWFFKMRNKEMMSILIFIKHFSGSSSHCNKGGKNKIRGIHLEKNVFIHG